jgi:hypothetical protein
MECDEWIIDNFVLKSAQIMIKGDDVLFEGDATRKRDPAFVSLNAGAGDGKPFVEFLWLTYESPYRVGAARNEVATAYGSHG